MKLESKRAGMVMNTTRGYSAFIPMKLPPDPPIVIDSEMQKLLSLADRKLGRLDGITQILPNPELFVAMYDYGFNILNIHNKGEIFEAFEEILY